ncbi:MAG: hypothetical protein C5S48_06305 [Candidatus Methanogaster sp.]|nr:MAG: hypothetical protein C5S48_06305 [ANME-2 cluster archaeon]
MNRMKQRKYKPETSPYLTGVFLRYSGASYIAEVQAALRDLKPYWSEIREVEANFEIVSNLIPMALQEGAESWLILYRSDKPQELLILPFPDPAAKYYTRNGKSVKLGGGSDLAVLPLLELIRGDWDKWFADIGYRNLKRNLSPKEPWWPRPLITRFQLVRINTSLDSLLRMPEVRRQPVEQQGIQHALKEASQRIQQQRNEVLAHVLEAEDEDHKQELITKFEEHIIEENNRLFDCLQSTREGKIIIPSIVRSFEEIIDDETKRFLISAETVEKFACEQFLEGFDFSLPGSGLWRAVERELNLSLVWYVRYCYGIVGNDPMIATENPSVRITIQAGSRGVNLNEREKGNSCRLRGITLGGIEYILRSSHDNGVAAKFQPVVGEEWLRFMTEKEGGLITALQRIRRIRNRHAHISAMSQVQYQQLHDLIFSPEEDVSESVLERVLRMKINILEYRRKID